MSHNPSACVVIPARYSSSRFPGKPLIPLLGKPMILWVAEASAKAVGKENVYVATESEQIAAVVQEAGFVSIMTSKSAITGTDRICEAANNINYDIYLNVQGDEPLVNPQDIITCIDIKKQHQNSIINGFCPIGDTEDPKSKNIPKVVMSENNKLIYMSRSLIPGSKDPLLSPKIYFKQVCIYGFNREQLLAFSEFGRKSLIEEYEDIEILRFLELDQEIMMFKCSPGSLAVDVPSDVGLVENALRLVHDLS